MVAQESVDVGKTIAQNLPFIGPTIQRYWFGGENYEWGSALKAKDRTGSYLPMVVPSIFGGVQRNYYFVYPGTEQVFMTHSAEKYQDNIDRGAKPFDNERVFEHWVSSQKIYPKFSPRYYSKRWYKPKSPKKFRQAYIKRVYAKRKYFKPAYVPRPFDMRVYNRVMKSARGTTFRMPGTFRSPHAAPALYRRLYTGSGLVRFQTRMIPITTQYLFARLRQDWSYLR